MGVLSDNLIERGFVPLTYGEDGSVTSVYKVGRVNNHFVDVYAYKAVEWHGGVVTGIRSEFNAMIHSNGSVEWDSGFNKDEMPYCFKTTSKEDLKLLTDMMLAIFEAMPRNISFVDNVSGASLCFD